MWGIPLPIWRCNRCGSLEIIGSLQELAKHFKANNRYIFLRHGEAISNVKNLLSSYPETFFNPLTDKGIRQIKNLIPTLQKFNIDFIVTSPLLRTRQTANIIREYLHIPVYVDFNLREIDFGVLNGKSIKEYDKLYKDQYDQYFKKPEGGESLDEVRKRMIKVILDLEKKYEGKTILIISHQDPLWALFGEMQALSKKQTAEREDFSLAPGELKEVEYLVVPRNEDGEIDIHRPFVDRFKWKCKCGGEKERIEDLADIWFDSGAAPFASRHYPFENKKEIDEGILYPIDFIVEGVDQTRGWFYTLLVIGYLIKKMEAYKNVISTGLVLDKEGRKMSKSLGNVVDPIEAMEKYGADLLRLYFVYVSESADNKKFNEEELINLKRNYFDLILNVL
jgi:isoleucyl-tRNA synthetase